MPKPDQRELTFIADALIVKVWQGDEAKRGLAVQCASVALAAIQDFTATLYMESADKFTGEDLMRAWLNRSQESALTPAPDEAAPHLAAWQRYHANHPEVLASWGEQNGRLPNCGCAPCAVSQEGI